MLIDYIYTYKTTYAWIYATYKLHIKITYIHTCICIDICPIQIKIKVPNSGQSFSGPALQQMGQGKARAKVRRQEMHWCPQGNECRL